MSLFTILTPLFFLIFATFITPATQIPTPLTHRSNEHKGIFICTGKSWTGTCSWHEIAPAARANYGSCISIKSPGGILSVGPDCGLEVKIYKKLGCVGGLVTGPLMYPGWGNMDSWLENGAETEQLWFGVRDTAIENRVFDDEAGCPKAYLGE
jgi:hypothetical protein